MALWNYCAICGKRIEVGEPCIGVENNTELISHDEMTPLSEFRREFYALGGEQDG